MQTIAVLNSKGGSGKTTVSINLASYYAKTGLNTVIIDYDSQGSSTHWVSTRNESQPHIRSIPAYQFPLRQTNSFQMRLDKATERVIIDSPGAITLQQLEKIVKRSDFILVPVQPSSIDIHAATGFIQQLLGLRQVQWGKTKVAVIANRTREKTDIFDDLNQFLAESNIPFLSSIKDSYNYVQATNEAKGVFEVESNLSIEKDKSDWHSVINWIEEKEVFETMPTIASISAILGCDNEQQLEQAV